VDAVIGSPAFVLASGAPDRRVDAALAPRRAAPLFQRRAAPAAVSTTSQTTITVPPS